MPRPDLSAGARFTAEKADDFLDDIEQMHTLDMIGGSLIKARTTDSATRNNTTTFASDTVLTYSNVPAGTYLVEASPRWIASGNTPDIKLALAMPTGGTILGSTFLSQATTATTAVGSLDQGSNAGATASGVSIGGRGATTVELHGFVSGVMVLPNAGTVALQWAPVTSDAATLKVDAGSWMRLTRLS
jgi:hypothetical protein